MAVGALGRIDQIGRVGQDQVELAVDGIEQVAVPRLQVVRRGQRGIHLGQAQRGGVDVHRQYLGLGSRQSGEDGSRTGATANVHGAPDVAPMNIQVRLDGTGETVGVRAEEHRIRCLGGKCRMHEQLAVKARQPHPAAPARAAGFEHAGLFHQAEDRRRQQFALERPAPAEHVGQILGQGILRPLVDPLVGEWRGGDEVVAALAQRLGQMQQRLILCFLRDHWIPWRMSPSVE